MVQFLGFSRSFSRKLVAPKGVDLMPFGSRFLMFAIRKALFGMVKDLPLVRRKSHLSSALNVRNHHS